VGRSAAPATDPDRCHLTLALLTLSVPVAGWLGRLRLEHLFLLEGVGGALAVLSNAASQAYVPSLVGTDHVVEANAKLATSRAVAQIVGPGLAGALVQLFSAPTAILADALSFALSAVCLLRIRVPELQPLAAARRGVWTEVHEGPYLLLRHRLLRPLVVAVGLYNLFAGLFVAVYTLFMVRALGLDPAAVGAVIAGGGIGGIVGGLGAEPASRRWASAGTRPGKTPRRFLDHLVRVTNPTGHVGIVGVYMFQDPGGVDPHAKKGEFQLPCSRVARVSGNKPVVRRRRSEGFGRNP